MPAVQPLVDAGTLRWRDVKMSMADGTNRHGLVGAIRLPAASTGFPPPQWRNSEALTVELQRSLGCVANAQAEGVTAELLESIARGAMRRLERCTPTNP
ncbi:MAG: hypothetical protein RLW62_17190 [Gammaproteobacteria bacterium]